MEEGYPRIKMSEIRNVCVIGAGTMGSGIAAHLANLGFQVTLLDLSGSTIHAAFDRAKQVKPPHFYLPLRADSIRLGSVQDNLDFVLDADWVCEAIFENLGAKRALYAQLEPLVRPHAIVTTNTSGLELARLSEGRSSEFRRKFLGTHFFNPPRYLKLLELIPTPEVDPEIVRSMTRFLELSVARRVVVAKDTPGFIANRFGMWAMYQAIHAAERLQLSVEAVDLITGPFLGRPKSGSFRLNDIVGLDVMDAIASNLIDRCPHDSQIGVLKTPASMRTLLDRGWIGGKASQGYYRREGKEFMSFDLTTGAYRQRQDPDLPTIKELAKAPLGERIGEAMKRRDEVGEYLRAYLRPALQYAQTIQSEVSHSVTDFDRVMRWGFGWQMGPFEMIDALDLASEKFYIGSTQRMTDGTYVEAPLDPMFAVIQDFPIVDTKETFRLRDLGDGVHAVSTTTKMGTISPLLVRELTELLEDGQVQRLVLTSEGSSFSAGFDLRFFLDRIEAQDFDGIDGALADLHRLGELLEAIPSVAAVYGYCLGAGLELALSCTRIVAAPESKIGLPESRVGLIPGGRGTVLSRLNNQVTTKRLGEVVGTLIQGEFADNADQARASGFLRQADVTCYNADALISRAKHEVQSLRVEPRAEWKTEVGPLAGVIDRVISEARLKDAITEYDEAIGLALKAVYSRSKSYEEALALERSEFLALCKQPYTLARIRHMLDNGKPLRN